MYSKHPWAAKKLFSRDYFIDLKLAQGYDIHQAHELWFKHVAKSKRSADHTRSVNKHDMKLASDRQAAQDKYPSHFNGGRCIKGVGV